MKIVEETPYRFRIEQEGAMRVPGIVFASRSLLPRDEGDMALMQVVNVATLPGIVGPRMRCPMCTGDMVSQSAAWPQPTSTMMESFPRRCRLRYFVRRKTLGRRRAGPRGAATTVAGGHGPA